MILQLNHDAVLDDYRRFREIRKNLNTKLTRQLTKKNILKGGRRLGLLVDNTLCLQTEEESSALMDFCIHDCRDMGRNAIDRFLARADLDEYERAALRTMQQARFSLFQVTGSVDRVGVEVLDLLSGKAAFLVDVSLGASAVTGLILATRVIPFGDHLATTGAALPLDAELFDDIREAVEHWGGADAFDRAVAFSAFEQGEFAALVLKTCLRAGAQLQMRYE